MKVTISDVARLAGVSTATVSHTINSTRYVSGETKEKVYRAIAELGYTPDASARSFRTGKKKTIGFIVPDISNKFFATMIESVENYLSAHGYHLIIANTKENPEREETNIRLLSAGLVDGLLIASTMEDFSRFESLIPAGFPVVLVDRTFDTKRFPSVSVSNFQPIYRSVCDFAAIRNRRLRPHASHRNRRCAACETYTRAMRKDEQALEAYRQLGVHVAAAIKIVVLTVDPEMIVFGGSVTAAHELFEESMYEDLKDFAYPNSIKNLKIRFSKLENPGLFGAASLCYDK